MVETLYACVALDGFIARKGQILVIKKILLVLHYYSRWPKALCEVAKVSCLMKGNAMVNLELPRFYIPMTQLAALFIHRFCMHIYMSPCVIELPHFVMEHMSCIYVKRG